MYSGLRRYSVECIHPTKKCVTQRIMTDNIFEVETAVIAMRTCFSEDPGILLTNFSCSHPSVDHMRIFMVLKRAVPNVEHAGAAREQFAMLSGVRQGCLASGYLFTMAFHPVFRWLLSSAIRPERCRLSFLQRCACACADDFALAAASLRESLPILAGAFAIIDHVTGMSHNYHKCHWIQYGNLTSSQLAERVGTHVPDFQHMQITDHAKHLGVVIGPGAPAHRCAKARHKFNVACARIRASSQSLVQRLGPFKINAYPFSPLLGPFLNLTRKQLHLKIWFPRGFQLSLSHTYSLLCDSRLHQSRKRVSLHNIHVLTLFHLVLFWPGLHAQLFVVPGCTLRASIYFIDPDDGELKETTLQAEDSQASQQAVGNRQRIQKIQQHPKKKQCVHASSRLTHARESVWNPRHHQITRITPRRKGPNSTSHYYLAYKFVPMPQAINIPDAKATVDTG